MARTTTPVEYDCSAPLTAMWFNDNIKGNLDAVADDLGRNDLSGDGLFATSGNQSKTIATAGLTGVPTLANGVITIE